MAVTNSRTACESQHAEDVRQVTFPYFVFIYECPLYSFCQLHENLQKRQLQQYENHDDQRNASIKQGMNARLRIFYINDKCLHMSSNTQMMENVKIQYLSFYYTYACIFL